MTNSGYLINNSFIQNRAGQGVDSFELIRAFSIMNNNAIYLVDNILKVFHHVSGNPVFLCGFTPPEIREIGFEYYSKFVLEKDLELVHKINEISNEFYRKIPLLERKEHFISYDFHLKKAKDSIMLVNQKTIPLSLNSQGRIRKALVVISLSQKKNSGNVKAQKANGNISHNYDLKKKCWRSFINVSLTEREKQVLRLSMKGFKIKEIAAIIHLTVSTVKFHRTKIFQKLNVSNVSEATSFVSSSLLL